MFFTLANSRTYIARPAAVTGDTVRAATPDGGDGTEFVNALEDTTARLWRPVGQGAASEVAAEWDAGDGGEITLSGVGLARCSLGGATVAVRYRRSALLPWTAAVEFSPAEGPLHEAQLFEETAARHWQFLITDAPPDAAVGWLWLGRWLRLPRGPQPPFTPPDLSTAHDVSTYLAEGAQSLGARAQLTAGQTALTLTDMPLPWLRAHWEPVRVHLGQGRPLLFIPDTAKGSIGLVQAARRVPPTRQTTRGLGDLSVTLRYLP